MVADELICAQCRALIRGERALYLIGLIIVRAAVENPANTVPPHKKQLPSSIPNFDTLEGFATDGNDDYSTFKKLQRQLECVNLQGVWLG